VTIVENKTTDELTNQLKETTNIESYIDDNKSEFLSDTVSGVLNKLLIKKDLKKSEVVKESNLHRSYVYEIFNGDKIPSRDKIIAIAFGMHLDLSETQQLLKRCGHRELYSRDRRDSIIMFAIDKKKSLIDCNILLSDSTEEIIK
jgi:transcriptional regulator with XRE-family HTH domain